jgi:hypothetical protein
LNSLLLLKAYINTKCFSLRNWKGFENIVLHFKMDRQDDIRWGHVSPEKFLLFSSIYYLGMDLLFYPFDTVKTCLQIRHIPEVSRLDILHHFISL